MNRRSFKRDLLIHRFRNRSLSWIKGVLTREMEEMVGSRVKEIKVILCNPEAYGCAIHFDHIASEENHADCATRVLSKEGFSDRMWWSGSPLLLAPVSQWLENLHLLKLAVICLWKMGKT